MSVFNNNLLLGAGGQSTGQIFDPTVIGNSVWLDGSADTLAKTFSSGSAQTKVVISTWVQRTSFGTSQDIFSATGGTGGSSRSNRIHFQTDDTIDIQIETTTVKTIIYSTTRVFRDIGWYHILLSIDQGESVGPAQVNLFVNGVAVTIAATVIDQGFSAAMSSWGNATLHNVGSNGGTGTFLNGSVAQTTMLVGQSIQNGDVAVTDFLDSFTYGTNGSQFAPKKDSNVAALASTAGGNSFCLDFANSSDLGNDISSNNNDFSLTSMAAANQSNSSASLVFSQWNILDANAAFTSANDGANTYVVTNIGGAGMRSTIPMSSGKWYWEHRNAGSNETGPAVAAGQGYVDIYNNTIIGTGSGSVSAYLATTGVVRINGGEIGSLGLTNGASAVVGVAFDADTGKLWFRDSSGFGSSGNPATGANPHTTLDATKGPYFIATRVGGSVPEPFLNAGGNGTFNGNETAGGNADENGRGNFKLGAVPAGFLALCSANLTAPEFQGADYFNTVLYTGNGTAIGSGGKAVTGVGFKPDWSWIKNRDAADSHSLYDLVRGTTKQLESDNTAVQTTEAEGLTTFGTDGFTVGNLAQVNTNTEDYVSWNWLGNNATESISASGANPTLASTNTASDSGAFGICTYTGNGTNNSTVKHSLGGVPDMIIFKRFGATTTNWVVYYKELGAGNSDYLMLDVTLAEGGAGAIAWLNSTAATSTLVTLGSDGNTNASDTFIMYLFRNVPGVCKVGTYEGNGNANGSYISVGFLPRWIMIKSADTAVTWLIYDTARSPINVANKVLYSNSTSAENADTGLASDVAIDILADGFKLRENSNFHNRSATTYTYIAMADIGGNGTLPPIYGE